MHFFYTKFAKIFKAILIRHRTPNTNEHPYRTPNTNDLLLNHC